MNTIVSCDQLKLIRIVKKLVVNYNKTIVRVFLLKNYKLIVAPRKFDVLKANICPRSEASSVNMLVLRTSNFQGELSDQ